MKSEMLVFDGGAVKALGDGRVGGYGVYFTNELEPDLDGDFFTSETNFELEDRTALPLYFSHGIDSTMQKRKLAKASFKTTDEGLWVETQLDIRDRWLQKIYELIQQGKLSFSSGAVGHLVERVKKGGANWVKTWPVGEVSFTPAPAAPFGTEVMPLKFYQVPSLKEIVRRSTLSPTQLLREESERVHALATQALESLENNNDPVRWAAEQERRRDRSSEQSVARTDWLRMRDKGKEILAESEEMLAESAKNFELSQKMLAETRRVASWRAGFHSVRHGGLELRRMAEGRQTGS